MKTFSNFVQELYLRESLMNDLAKVMRMQQIIELAEQETKGSVTHHSLIRDPKTETYIVKLILLKKDLNQGELVSQQRKLEKLLGKFLSKKEHKVKVKLSNNKKEITGTDDIFPRRAKVEFKGSDNIIATFKITKV